MRVILWFQLFGILTSAYFCVIVCCNDPDSFLKIIIIIVIIYSVHVWHVGAYFSGKVKPWLPHWKWKLQYSQLKCVARVCRYNEESLSFACYCSEGRRHLSCNGNRPNLRLELNTFHDPHATSSLLKCFFQIRLQLEHFLRPNPKATYTINLVFLLAFSPLVHKWSFLKVIHFFWFKML